VVKILLLLLRYYRIAPTDINNNEKLHQNKLLEHIERMPENCTPKLLCVYRLKGKIPKTFDI
jgi:hypothetical protein